MTASLADGNALDIIGANGATAVTGDAATRHLRAGQEFYPHRVSASGAVTAPLAFVGFGISAPHLSYTDYNGDVKGKAVLRSIMSLGSAIPTARSTASSHPRHPPPGARRSPRSRRARPPCCS